MIIAAIDVTTKTITILTIIAMMKIAYLLTSKFEILTIYQFDIKLRVRLSNFLKFISGYPGLEIQQPGLLL